MHWAESTIYFSSALLISPIVPLWVFRLLSLGLLVSFAVAKLFGINIAFEDCCFKESLIFIEGFIAKLISIMVQSFWTWGFVNLQQLKEVIQNPDSNVGFPIGGPLGIRQVGEWGGGINVFMSGWMGHWMDGWMDGWMDECVKFIHDLRMMFTGKCEPLHPPRQVQLELRKQVGHENQALKKF